MLMTFVYDRTVPEATMVIRSSFEDQNFGSREVSIPGCETTFQVKFYGTCLSLCTYGKFQVKCIDQVRSTNSLSVIHAWNLFS